MSDLISRQAVIDLFTERMNGWTLEEAIPIVDRFVNEREHCDDVWYAVVTIRDVAECVKQDVEKYLPSANVMTFEEIAKLLSDLYGECACDVNGNDEWLPQVCKYAETECPQPKEKNGCWMQFLIQGGADMRGE